MDVIIDILAYAMLGLMYFCIGIAAPAMVFYYFIRALMGKK